MHKRSIIIAALAAVLSFAAGFWLANSLNESEIASLRATQINSDPNAPNPQKNFELPDSEIRQKLKEAEANPNNFAFQKNLGLALYRYAASKKDAELLGDVEVLLKRANALNPDDYEVLVSFANINFDLGQLRKDETRIEAARELYTKALKKNPKDANVIADIGYSYLESANPEPEKAISHLEDAYKIDPKSERILVSLSFAYSKMKNSSKAGEYLAKLKTINPENEDIKRIESELNKEAAQ